MLISTQSVLHTRKLKLYIKQEIPQVINHVISLKMHLKRACTMAEYNLHTRRLKLYRKQEMTQVLNPVISLKMHLNDIIHYYTWIKIYNLYIYQLHKAVKFGC